MSEPVLVTRSDAVCEVRLNRPEKRNAITFLMYEQLTAALSAPTSCSYMRRVMALRFSGRLRRTSQTPSARETRTGSLMPAACGSNR